MMELNIKKDKWTKVKLLDVFIKREENDKENAHNRFDRFLKVEHLDKESLHIKRWCSQESGDEINPTFYKVFRKGQILFPTRNPHLRRTALASFDGVCGEKTLTLEPKPEFLIPEFIPFLFHSESFYAHTTGAIVGSTNPHVRWRDVANYEFLLPPKDQQAQLAEFLWAMDEVIERDKAVLDNLEYYKFGLIENFISKKLDWINDSPNWSKFKLKDILSIPEKIKATNIDRDKLITVRLYRKGVVKNETVDGLKIGATTYFVRRSGQFIYGKQNLHNGALGIVPDELDGFLSSSDIPTLDINKELVVAKYLETYIGRESFYKFLEKYSAGSGAKRISEKVLMNLEIELPPLDTQIKFIELFESIEESLFNSQSKILGSQSLQKSLINQIFSSYDKSSEDTLTSAEAAVDK